jgi:hypothetical protein
LKRLAAIVLLSIHLFFTGGYVLVFQYLINQADSKMVKQVYDSKIDDHRLVLLKIPVNMPTITDWTDYETVAGQIQLKDAYYNYVKLKMTRDTMYLVCYANTAKTRLVKANIISAKEFSDVPMSKKTDAIAKKLITLSEYNLYAFNYQYSLTGNIVKPSYFTPSSELNNPYISSPGKPPNTNC